MLPTIISKLGLPLLVNLIGTALGRIDSPIAKNASDALQNFEGALAGGVISSEQMAEANRHAEKIATIKSKEYEAALTQINQSLRTEIASEDPFVRRMRPTFGYLLAATWSLQMIGIAYVMVFDTDKIDKVLNGMEGLSAIWAVALSVLGIYVYKRSEEKRVFLSPETTAQPNTKSVTTTIERKTNIVPNNASKTYNE